jgi:release factor glutamine methyltransferase
MNLLTLKKAIAAAAGRLDGADATRDAQLLLLHAIGIARTALFTDPDRLLTEEELAVYDAAIARRAAGEPVQYITGQQEFYGLMLKVSPAVLIPRPETELLVEAVLERLPADRETKIADVGTGSGAIAIVLAYRLPKARVTAVDLSQAALAVSRDNAAVHGVTGRVRLLSSDLLAAVAGEVFDAVVSNPPYVPEADRDSLDRQVREFEPPLALFAGDSGLDVYKRLIPQALAVLKPGGLLAMEIGFGQGEALAELLAEWDGVEFLDDLRGIPRVALARRRGV